MQNIIIFFLVLLSINQHNAFSETIKNDLYKISTLHTINLKGVIGIRNKISMSLTVNDSTVTGYYEYEKIGLPISLRGSLSTDGDMILEEFPGSLSQVGQVEPSGTFHGKISDSYNFFEGNWTSETASYKFKLKIDDADKKSLKFEYNPCLNKEDSNCKNISLILLSTGDINIDNLLLKNSIEGYKNKKMDTFMRESAIYGEHDKYEEYEEWTYFTSYKEFNSYIEYSSTYSDGTHPMSEYTYYTINTNTNSIVNLKDYINDIPQFLNLLHINLKLKYNSISTEKLKNDNSLPDNFFFCNYGIGVMYNRYIFGSYAEGPLEIVIPWKEISQTLNHNVPDRYSTHAKNYSICQKTWIGYKTGYSDAWHQREFGSNYDTKSMAPDGYSAGYMVCLKVLIDGLNAPPDSKESRNLGMYILKDDCVDELQQYIK